MARIVNEIPIIHAPAQEFTASLAQRRCDFRVFYTETSGRWSFDLSIEGVEVLLGRRIIVGADLLAAFGLGIGELWAEDPSGGGAQPGRTELPDGLVRLYHAWDDGQ